MIHNGAPWHVTWHCAQLASSEHCTLAKGPDGYEFCGVVVTPLAQLPCHIDYSVLVDLEWRPRRVQATVTSSSGKREIDLQSRPTGGWEMDGAWVPDLVDCHDVDLGWTPATNTIPVRRLGLQIGESRSITAAWIRFPELDVVRNVQRYTRIGSDVWRYEAGEYEFEIVVDATTGLVLAYGDDLWRASDIARAST
jgi:hypothetical protein